MSSLKADVQLVAKVATRVVANLPATSDVTRLIVGLVVLLSRLDKKIDDLENTLKGKQ